MVDNLLDHIIKKRDKKYQFVEFPSVLDQIKSEGAQFELSISNTIAKLDLYHKSSIYKQSFQNIVEKSIGLVFVNSKALELEYTKGKIEDGLKRAVNRMKNFWRVDELDIIRDPTKEQVEKAFDQAKQSIVEFNNNQSEKEVLAVIVRWIGWDIELNRKQHSFSRKNQKTQKKERIEIKAFKKQPVDGPTQEIFYNDKSYKFDRYGILTDGTAISVDSYCLKLANE